MAHVEIQPAIDPDPITLIPTLALILNCPNPLPPPRFYLLWLIDVKRYYYPQKVKEWVGPAPTDEDRDVAAERSRVEGGAADSSLIRMTHLRKTFPQPRVKNKPQPRKVAVENLSLAMDGQGCFALLGPNGAGKTTTLSMLTGDLRPSAGEAFVAGYSIRTELMQIFKILHAEPGLDPRDQQMSASPAPHACARHVGTGATARSSVGSSRVAPRSRST